MDKQTIVDWAEAHKEEFIADLATLIAIRSVRGEAQEGKPASKRKRSHHRSRKPKNPQEAPVTENAEAEQPDAAPETAEE